MNYTINELAQESYVHIKFFGELNDGALMKYLNEVFVIPESGSRNQPIDYSKVTDFLLTPAGILEFCNKINNYCDKYPQYKDKKIALVNPTNIPLLDYPTGHIFLSEILSDKTYSQLQFLLSKADAPEGLRA